MSAEIPHEFGKGMISCAQLEREEVDLLENSVAAEFKVVLVDHPSSFTQDGLMSKQLVEDMEGTCITGQRHECPKSHNCGKVRITTSVPPLFIEIDPLKVNDA